MLFYGDEELQPRNPLAVKEKGDISVAQSNSAPRPSLLSKFWRLDEAGKNLSKMYSISTF